MATAEHRGPNGHEVCDCVVAIADELRSLAVRLGRRGEEWEYFLEVVCDECLDGVEQRL